jgi:uncharacterized protein
MTPGARKTVEMIPMEDIQAYANRIAEAFHPEKIILFGSYAYGTPTSLSDVDLLVIMPFAGKWTEQAVDILMQIRVPWAVDLLVKSPQKIRERQAIGDSFLKKIFRDGKLLFEAREALNL